jgi:DNA (cytosine-5)-methyltransferase 1
MSTRTVANHHAATLSALDMRIVRSVPPGGNWRDIPDDIPSRRLDQIREGARSGTGSRSTYYGRLRPDRPAYTINTYYHRPGNGCTIHPVADRVLTDREAARLQTFPDAVILHGPARARQSQVGNALPPLLAAQLARGIPAGPMVDLFSGAGGLSLGASLVGHELLAAVDLDRHALTTLRRTHDDPEVVVAADLTDPLDRARVLREIDARLDGRQLNLLAGGPPCQGFSTAGVCVPDDPRNRLLFEFVRCVEHWRPRHLLVENVIGLWFRGRAVLNDALSRLAALGYHLDSQVMHAEAFGVPQRRRRLIVQGSLDSTPTWPTPWRQTVDPCYRQLQKQHAPGTAPAPFSVDDAIGDLPDQPDSNPAEQVAITAAAPSDLARWLRGELSLEKMLPTYACLTMPPELTLFAA